MLAIRSREGRAFAPPIIAFFVMLAVAAMLGGQGSAAAGAARAKAGSGHAGKTHRRHAKPRCVSKRPKRARKPRRRHGARASRHKVTDPHKVGHARKPKKCPATRRSSKQPLIVGAPFAPSQPSSPGGVALTSTPTPGSAATAPPKSLPVEEPTSKQEYCIRKPSACGYPDATNTGVPAGTTLTSESTTITVSKPDTTIEDLRLNAKIEVEADKTTIKDSEVSAGGGEGDQAIWIAPGVTGTVIEDDSIHGEGSSGDEVVQNAIESNSSSTQITHVYAYNCTECFTGPGNVSDSFLDVTGTIPGEHYEDVYYGGGNGSLIANHNTMLNPQDQTAVVFASVDFGNQTTLTITNNLMAGGDYVLYGGTSGSGGSVLGPVTVTGNRFSRIYFANGGTYGPDVDFNDAVTAWSDNIWDDTLKQVPEA